MTTSAELVEAIREAVPAPAQRTGGHPAKRTFQALRIEVNDELGALRRALPAAIDALAVHGRIVVMSYQSLEDRIAKRALAEYLVDDVPVDLPVPGRGPELRPADPRCRASDTGRGRGQPPGRIGPGACG